MKKTVLFVSIFILIIGFVLQISADSGNPHYDKFLILKRMAEEANDAGQYDKAYELSLEAQSELKLAEEYRAMLVKKSKADQFLKYASDRIGFIERNKLNEEHAEAYNKARENYDLAVKAYEAGEYDQSVEYSKMVLDDLAGIKLADGTLPDLPDPDINNTMTEVKPKYYVVRLILSFRDCLWKIASYDFVYGDGFKWKVLYQANKGILKDPDNPHLIYPGQIITIPELEGEKREGTYDPSAK